MRGSARAGSPEITMLADRIARMTEGRQPAEGRVELYLGRLLDRHWELGARQRRALFWALLLAGVFVLLANRKAGGITVAGVQVTDVGPFLLLFPPLVVGLVAHAVWLSNEKGLIRDVYDGLVEKWWPQLHGSELHYLLIPAGTIFGTGRDPADGGTRYHRVQDRLQDMEGVLLALLLPVGFTCYAFYRLFHDEGPSNPFLWLSLVTTAGLFVLLARTRRGPVENYPRDFSPKKG